MRFAIHLDVHCELAKQQDGLYTIEDIATHIQALSDALQFQITIIIQMLSIQKCSQCLSSFNMVKLPRKLPNCPHSICQTCLREIIDTKQEIIICGFCSSLVKKNQIRVFSLNTALLITLSEAPTVRPSILRVQEKIVPKDPILIEPQSEETNETEELCSKHKVLMDIICISDKQKICPHCALFGEHKDHRVKRVDDFQKEISEKRKALIQIQTQKAILVKSDNFKIYQQLKRNIELKIAQLSRQIQQQYKNYLAMLMKAKEKAFEDVKAINTEVEQYFTTLPSVVKFQKSKGKFQKWQKTCLKSLQQIDCSQKIQDKLFHYYDGPLEIVTQGFIFVEELNKYGAEAMRKLSGKLNKIEWSKCQQSICFEKLFMLKKGVLTPNVSMRQQQVSQINPFLDCTASQITYAQSNIFNNTTLQAQISTITKQIRGEKSMIKFPKKELQLKSVKSLDKQKQRTPIQVSKLTLSPKTTSLKRPSSEAVSYKFSPRILKTTTLKEIVPQAETKQLKQPNQFNQDKDIKPFELKQPQKIYQQFIKNTLTDFFDISQCSLPSDKVVEYVHRAKRVHRIKGLKLCNNRLTTVGFEKMTQYLQGVSNINLANNNINEEIFDAIFHNRDKLQSLKMINLSHNPITLDKKSTARMEDIKRCGIIVIL